MGNKRVCVVVLGDIGRSPRMQYHALSLALEGYNVDLVGYSGSEPIQELKGHPNVNIRHIAACPDIQKYCPRLTGYILKTLWQCVTLFFTLLCKRLPSHVLVQSPPAIPTLALCWIYASIVRAKYIIDWHNYGYTILALALGNESALVVISKWFEGWFGRRADVNLCVTKAMENDLKIRYNIQAITLYDRPPECFKPVSVETSHDLFRKLSHKYDVFRGINKEDTAFTEVNETGNIMLKINRPGLLVSSTSWTEDEDFSVLLSALQNYEDISSEKVHSLPHLICVITGKGPLKQYYCDLIDKKKWNYVSVITPWLEPCDYPHLLASADLGISLHISSSGLDLPMKVADMFGCGLPVCAYNFSCLVELVQHEKNSYVFNTSEELSSLIQSWFREFPNNKFQDDIKQRFKAELENYRSVRWHKNWCLHAAPVFS